MLLRTLKYVALAVCLLAAVSLPAYSAPLTGTLNISGAVQVGATTIDWLTLPGGGQFVVDPSSTGSFGAFIGDHGGATNLDVTVQPVGSPFVLPNFLTLPGLSFTLTFISPGVFSSAQCFVAPAPGQVCTPPIPAPKSPFNLINTATGAAVSLSVSGTVQATGGPVQDFKGVYTTQFVGQNYQSLLAQISGGGKVSASYSGNFQASIVPEPSTEFLTWGGLALLAVGTLRRKLVKR
jgi:hypothetical protein